MAIDRETLDYVAHLSRIELQEDELEKLSGQLKEVVNFIDKLKDADIENIAPTSHILPLNNILRKDTPRDSLSVEEALRNAPQKEGSFFVVPKVIE